MDSKVGLYTFSTYELLEELKLRGFTETYHVEFDRSYAVMDAPEGEELEWRIRGCGPATILVIE